MKAINLYMYRGKSKLEWMPHQKVMYEAFVKQIKDNQTVKITFQINKPAKTLPQLGYWYGVLMPVACEALREAGHDTLFEAEVGSFRVGLKTTVDTTDKFFKQLFGVYSNVPELPLKRKMTVEEMGELIDFTLKWLAENLNCFAPTPEE